MQRALTLASGLHKALGNVFFALGGDIDAERHAGITNHRVFFDGDRPRKPYPNLQRGLGILAGDTLRSAADLRLPMVGVTLLHRKGYGFQP
jgi:glucan phosphorylase